MSDTDQKLIVFEQSISDLVDCLRFNVIRMAAIHDEPWAPLRPGKEITYDPTGIWVLPNSRTGISLAASMKQLRKVFGKGRKNCFLRSIATVHFRKDLNSTKRMRITGSSSSIVACRKTNSC